MQGKMRRGQMIEIAIDRTGLYETVQQQNAKGSLNNNDKNIETKKNEGLLGHIESLIKFRGGPITVHEFMSEALTNPTYGYYTKTSSKDKVFEDRDLRRRRRYRRYSANCWASGARRFGNSWGNQKSYT